MTLKRKLLALVSSLFLATSVFAAPSISGPHVTMQTDGSLSTGQANIITNNAGPIQFFTKKTLCGYFDGSTCALTGVSIGTPTLTNPTISGNLTFSTAAAKIIPGATSLTFRNNADAASNISITDAGVVTLRDSLINATAGKGIILGASSIPSDVTSSMLTLPLHYVFTTGNSQALIASVHGQANSGGVQAAFAKSRAVDGTADTIVQSADSLFSLGAFGADGASFISAAYINFEVDGTPGTNDMPGRIVFKTTPDGSSNAAEVLRLSNDKAALFTGTIRSSATSDIGWSVVSGANTACNTTCTSACVVGQETTSKAFLACTDATADVCICAGAS